MCIRDRVRARGDVREKMQFRFAPEERRVPLIESSWRSAKRLPFVDVAPLLKITTVREAS
eukprot:568186-Pyramimonas_sp.AAC.1